MGSSRPTACTAVRGGNRRIQNERGGNDSGGFGTKNRRPERHGPGIVACRERFDLIGDCSAVGNIQKVMRSAYIAASQF